MNFHDLFNSCLSIVFFSFPTHLIHSLFSHSRVLIKSCLTSGRKMQGINGFSLDTQYVNLVAFVELNYRLQNEKTSGTRIRRPKGIGSISHLNLFCVPVHGRLTRKYQYTGCR
jgi:hypothetical protein